MGIYIYMDILPNKIDKEEWERVYEESLQLVLAYPFMDDEVDLETYGEMWRYALRTDETEMEFDYNDHQPGWHLYGDYETMLGAESFSLFRNIESYRKKTRTPEGSDDILAKEINWTVFYGQEERQIPVGNVTIFDAKTQGFPFHNYILAIACLLESRFPKQVLVTGDISIGQMRKAMEWANTILEKPIHLTERADNDILLRRIRRLVDREFDALKSFMHLTMHATDEQLGKTIREQFTPEVIKAYFIDRLKQSGIQTLGFQVDLSEFLHLGFNLEQACEICVLDEDGCQVDAREFAKTVFSLEWHFEGEPEHDETPLRFNEPESEEPETVDSQFEKVLMQMAGFQESMKVNMTYEDVAAILQHKLGDLVEMAPLLEEKRSELAQNEESEEEINDLLLKLMADRIGKGKSLEPAANYTISDLDYLVLWKEGDSLHPNIEKRLKQLKDFRKEMMERNKERFDDFHACSDYDKMRWLIQSNRYFVIRKEAWDYYRENINDTDLINAVLSILFVKAEEKYTNQLCKAVLNNVALLKKYIVFD
ncbi:hypothetical protein [Virgibacillus kimchii]